MSTYRESLSQFKSSTLFASGLINHLNTVALDDISIKYEIPTIIDNRGDPKKKTHGKLDPKKIRLPARLNGPLIPYPPLIKENILDLAPLVNNLVHGHHQHHLTVLNNMQLHFSKLYKLSNNDIRFKTNDLARLTKCSYSSRTNIINTSALEFAKRATAHELSICAMEPIPYNPSTKITSPYLSFLISMQRMRVLLALKGDNDLRSYPEEQEYNQDATATVYKDATYSYVKSNLDETYLLLVAGSQFRLYHSSAKYWFAGSTTYLDYALTLSDTINNLEILSFDNGYSWASKFFRIIIELAEDMNDHNLTVNFMKSLEGFLLNLSDYDENFAMNWVPIMEAAHELWLYDTQLCNHSYIFAYIPSLLHDNTAAFPKQSYLCRFIHEAMSMTREQRQEISALHKFVFYAEVDAQAGVKKFLKRVHNKRKYDQESVNNITRIAKRDFIIAYSSKHKTLPTFKEENQKTSILRMNYSSNTMNKLFANPLKWWDDITPWNCMDNTLTDDALEFAKDKGALKGEITFGPGDSKKELLQVIQKDDYKLKDLMKDGKFERQPKYIELRRQSEKPIHHPHPARLIEKEREQKIEARLFANGELSNKHALSVYTTKMKKVLAYYDEQLMTPADSKRKEILHLAAQNLRKKNNYSMLLDIEGHNQSMQEGNTYDLLEFIGNIFGESGWGSLSNYFGALLVYHYDEYLDEVIVSKGQHGGIEGWMNPAWTLHTLLMMKLLRNMTDIDVQQLMVYSDDVDAIIKLDQASESSIQALFSKIMDHCSKFGMIAKFSQTTLSKHRATMLRQHYADGIRADSTLKRLMSVSGANNSMLVSEELEVAGICSSTASSLEASNHNQTCCYLKNYKLGILLARLPHMVLSKPQEVGSLSMSELPTKLAELLYHVKDESMLMTEENIDHMVAGVRNDLMRLTLQHKTSMESSTRMFNVSDLFSHSLAREKFLDNPDRLLYLQIYDPFIQDLLFFLINLPASIGGLGGIFHLNMMLSGHSNGFSKSIHYMKEWICKYSSNPPYFLQFLTNALSNSVSDRKTEDQHEILTTQWPSEKMITSATSSVTSAITSMVRMKTRNINVKHLFDQADNLPQVAKAIVDVFKTNYHPRIAQFYYENSSVHFIDLLINKIETSSGLLLQVKNLARLRKSLAERTLKNIRTSSTGRINTYGSIYNYTNMISYLMIRRQRDFPTIKFIKAEEILYDDKITIVNDRQAICTIRKCVPTHFEDGITVYNNPKVGNEILYKGEYLDHNRMIGNKEELLAAKVCSITKWLLTKTLMTNRYEAAFDNYDCVIACNITLLTLTGHKFSDLMLYCPDETGGEILHRIPNMRFSTTTYIRSELNRSLGFTNELSQYSITERNLIDSNINFDYLRLRLTLAMMIKDESTETTSVISRFDLKNLEGVHDVQFVHPEQVSIKIDIKIRPYAEFRKHKFSDLRFRFLAASYLTTDDIMDLSLLPNKEIMNDLKKFGDSIIGDIIYKYARSLDKEYMTLMPTLPNGDIWEPLHSKISPLIKNFQELSTIQKQEKIMWLLERELKERLDVNMIGTRDKVTSILQTEILSKLLEDHPNDQIYASLTMRYLQIRKTDYVDSRFDTRISDYNSFLKTKDQYTKILCKALISEIIVMLFFCVKNNMGMLIMDVLESVNKYEEVGLLMTILHEISPELYIRSLIIGPSTLKEYYSKNKSIIITHLYDISADIINYDMEVPELHLSTKNVTHLPDEWEMPDSGYSIEYHVEPIGDHAMETITDLQPMLKYIERTCDFSTNPAVYESLTGSDSCQAQFALFNCLKREFNLNADINICDLTAGRGDGQYALKNAGLNGTSYSRSDIFTNVLHHPKIIFSNDYDVFKTETLQFITEFDFIHIDISFTGKENPDVSDCVLYLESLSLPYTLRLNSVNLIKYGSSYRDLETQYSHYICHSISSNWRPYQVYLIGIPGPNAMVDNLIELKKSASFRSMALSYTSMLKNGFTNQYSTKIESNSISICLPNQNSVSELLSHVSNRCIVDERNYYLQRFLIEYIGDNSLYIVKDNLPPNVIKEVEQLRGQYKEVKGAVYLDYSQDDIGQVSEGSRWYHERHITRFHDRDYPKLHLELNRSSVILLNLLRRHHPLHDIRRLCNILLGIARMCPEIETYNRTMIESALKPQDEQFYNRQTRSQKDMAEAIKLHIVSLSTEDELLPLKYCTIMGVEYTTKKRYYERIRKYVKMLSGYRPLIKQSLLNGMIKASAVATIGDELFIRRCMNYDQARKYTIADQYNTELISKEFNLEINFDDLFQSLEKFSLSSELSNTPYLTADPSIDDPFSRLEDKYKEMFKDEHKLIDVDMKVEERISEVVDRLGLEIDPVTGIYKGFDIDEPDDIDMW